MDLRMAGFPITLLWRLVAISEQLKAGGKPSLTHTYPLWLYSSVADLL